MFNKAVKHGAGGVSVNQADHFRVYRARVLSLVTLLDACKAAMMVQLPLCSLFS